jgi:HAD superfamily hydrolase (TIGR01509 family)
MKAIILDCDGVLVDSEAIYHSAEIRFMAELGIEVDRNAYAERFMGLPTEVYFKTLHEAYANQLNGPFPDDFEIRFKAWSHEQIQSNLKAIPGINEYVASVKLPKAVASSTKLKFLHQKLEMTGLSEFFAPHIYSGEQMARGKPFPDLFLHAAAQLNVDSSECVVIEDSANGVKAGVAAGMHVIGFCGGGHCSERHDEILLKAGAHDIAHNYDDVRKLI